ncbi:melanoma-associated antigen B17-like [Elephas maximus indicus]|uniref:melanoma-associated antigen B17-like n=1 Tax=Elephas maximus indicus TaxID=99487 RepID=UPI0021168B82|nr:melanoma-associated antigen B17-like [Elephas maximus indicus]
MPRGHKSKLCAREKHRQAQGDSHRVQGAQATAAEEEGSLSSSSPFGGLPSAPLLLALPTGRREPHPPPLLLQVLRAEEVLEGPRTKMREFLLSKYEMQEHITKGKMMKIINKRYKEHFPEILRRASEYTELVFGLDMKEVDSKGQSYTTVSKLEITKEEKLSGGRGFPKTGLLMPLLAMIYRNGNQATEEEMWEFLNVFGMYNGKTHFIFREPRKLITKDLVQAKYLEYWHVPNSDPPCYKFLWGPRAQAEASKRKVLEFSAKVNDTNSGAIHVLYKAVWGDEEEIATGRDWAGAYPHARAGSSDRESPASPLLSSEF